MRRLPFLAMTVIPLLSACTPTETETETTDESKDDLTIVTDKIEIEDGDVFMCVYTGVITEKEISVRTILGKQAEGGHHITVYTTDETEKTGYGPCTDAEMTSWRMVGGADTVQAGEPVIPLPEGIAYKLPAGKQIALQLHYINTTGAPYDVVDEVTLQAEDPAEVKEYANLFSVADLAINIPANSKTTRVNTMTMKEDLKLVVLGGHMHELGTHYKIELAEEGGPLETVYEHDWADAYVSHPPTRTYEREEPLVLTKGTTIRQTCIWENDTPEDVGFPREMCVMFGYYYPDQGDAIILFAKPEAQ